jgi:hypothetical protein
MNVGNIGNSRGSIMLLPTSEHLVPGDLVTIDENGRVSKGSAISAAFGIAMEVTGDDGAVSVQLLQDMPEIDHLRPLKQVIRECEASLARLCLAERALIAASVEKNEPIFGHLKAALRQAKEDGRVIEWLLEIPNEEMRWLFDRACEYHRPLGPFIAMARDMEVTDGNLSGNPGAAG